MHSLEVIQTTAQKFWSKVQILSENECWPWYGCFTRNGYGTFCVCHNGQPFSTSAHRIGYMLHYNVYLTKEEFVCHKCDNRKCCNPDHLFVGSVGDNNRDMWHKGRGKCSYGTKRYNAKLTENEVRQIKLLLKQPDRLSYGKIGKFFGVNPSTIRYIDIGRNWKYI